MLRAIGVIPVLLGLLVSTSSWMRWVGPNPTVAAETLQQGFLWFRVMLVLLGLSLVALAFLGRRREASPRRAAATPVSTTVATTLALILGLAALLRVYALGVGPWFDEILTHVRYVRVPLGQIVTSFDSQNQHLLFSVFARLTTQLLGDGVWQLRLPAAIFGVAGIAALWPLALRLCGARVALLSTALLACSYHHVWFSQNARGYTGLMLWTVLSGWYLLRGLDGEGHRAWFGYSVCVALGFYTHLTMIFVVAGHGAMFVWRLFRRDGRTMAQKLEPLLFGLFPAGLLTLTLYAPVLPQLLGGTLEHGGAVKQWSNPLWALVETLRGFSLGPVAGGALLAGGIVFAAGCRAAWKRAPELLELWVFPVAICAVAVVARGHHLWPRFFFFSAGFAIVLVVLGVVSIAEWAARTVRIGDASLKLCGTLAGLLLVSLSLATVPRAWAPKQDYRAAMRFVQGQSRPGDVIVTVGMTSMPYAEYFGTDWTSVETAQQLEQVRQRAGTTWLLYTMPPHLATFHPDVAATIESEFSVIEQFPGTLGGGAIFVCSDDKHPVLARSG